MWRLMIVTENNTASILVDEGVALHHIEDWTRYEAQKAEAEADAEQIGQVYLDREGPLVRRIDGFYIVDDGDDEKVEKKAEIVPEAVLKRAIIAYRYREIIGMSANELE